MISLLYNWNGLYLKTRKEQEIEAFFKYMYTYIFLFLLLHSTTKIKKNLRQNDYKSFLGILVQ